jgi:hypothetical protein
MQQSQAVPKTSCKLPPWRKGSAGSCRMLQYLPPARLADIIIKAKVLQILKTGSRGYNWIQENQSIRRFFLGTLHRPRLEGLSGRRVFLLGMTPFGSGHDMTAVTKP